MLRQRGADGAARASASRHSLRQQARRRARLRRRDDRAWRQTTPSSWRCRPMSPRAAPRARSRRRIPRHRQRPFPLDAAGRPAADHRRAQRHGGMDVRVSRPALGDDQRRRPPGRYAARGAGADDLARGLRSVTGLRPADRAALADRARAPRHLRRDAGAGRQAARRARRAGAISCSPAIGPIPACPRPSKARSAPAIAPPNWSSTARKNRPNDDACSDIDLDTLDRRRATRRRCSRCQRPDGHWVFELEADATIPAEYVLLRHYLGEPVDAALERKIAVYLRRIQGEHGGWPLFHDGDFDISASVKAYFALKMIGDAVDAPHMRARARGDPRRAAAPARANVFTRILLALFGIMPWRAVPVMPVEIMLLPRWFPFHLDKISYWSRTVIVPLLVLMAMKPRARNPKGVAHRRIVPRAAATLGPAPKAPQQKASWFWFFRAVDDVLRAAEPLFPEAHARSAPSTRAVALVTERLNGEDGLGAIFPAMANSVMMFDALGYPEDRSAARHRAPIDREASGRARRRGLLPALRVAGLGHRARLPCAAGSRRRRRVSAQVAARARLAGADAGARRATATGPRGGRDVRPGGWAFQYANPHYPDVDDTAVVAMAMDRVRGLPASRLSRRHRARAGMDRRHAERERRLGRLRCRQRVLLSQQHPVRRSRRAARSADRGRHARAACRCWRSSATRENAPAVARGDRLPAPDATGRRQLVRPLGHELHLRHLVGAVRAQRRGRRPRRAGNAQGGGTGSSRSRTPTAAGARTARATSSTISGYEQAPSHRVADRLGAARPDGGGRGRSSGGRARHRLSRRQRRAPTASGTKQRYTATGFPRVFYLRYHGYAKFFPLWALARYRNLKSGNAKSVAWGM